MQVLFAIKTCWCQVLNHNMSVIHHGSNSKYLTTNAAWAWGQSKGMLPPTPTLRFQVRGVLGWWGWGGERLLYLPTHRLTASVCQLAALHTRFLSLCLKWTVWLYRNQWVLRAHSSNLTHGLWCLDVPSCTLYSFFYCLHQEAQGISVPWPGIEPVPPALGAQSLNHWTTKEVCARYTWQMPPKWPSGI